MSDYEVFLEMRRQQSSNAGFEPVWMPDFLYDFQRHLVDWAIRKGRAAIFADCGLGKTPMQLVWARNVVRYTNKPVLILSPLAVGPQTVREADKFGIEAEHSRDGRFTSKIVVTNYERLHYFDHDDFSGVVCDESSCIKHMNSKRAGYITEFMRVVPYRLLCTATAAPNDYVELGTSSEALGYLGNQDMITRFFKQLVSKDHLGWGRAKYRLKQQAEEPFWRWVNSWARVLRLPSDYGFDDGPFVLPKLNVTQTTVNASRSMPGYLFAMPAMTLPEQREERRQTIIERCQRVAELVADAEHSVSWCHLNDEGDMLARLIDGAVQVSGKDSDDAKEEKLIAFQSGQIQRLVTKSVIAGWGLNWQHCHRTTMFPSHSFEQYYQSIRRFYRVGQEHDVDVHIVTTAGEENVLGNLMAKSHAVDAMFDSLVINSKRAMHIERSNEFTHTATIPEWITSS